MGFQSFQSHLVWAALIQKFFEFDLLLTKVGRDLAHLTMQDNTLISIPHLPHLHLVKICGLEKQLAQVLSMYFTFIIQYFRLFLYRTIGYRTKKTSVCPALLVSFCLLFDVSFYLLFPSVYYFLISLISLYLLFPSISCFLLSLVFLRVFFLFPLLFLVLPFRKLSSYLL